MANISKFLKTLQSKNLTLALAESITCGMASQLINTSRGTSEVFMGSIICYNEKVKTGLLKINPGKLKKYTAESQEVTKELAKNLKLLIDADIYAAITGLAVSGGSETASKPVGTVFICVEYKGAIGNKRFEFSGTPNQIKKKACTSLFNLIIETVT